VNTQLYIHNKFDSLNPLYTKTQEEIYAFIHKHIFTLKYKLYYVILWK